MTVQSTESEDSRIEINGKVYPVAAVHQVGLLDLLVLEAETERLFGRRIDQAEFARVLEAGKAARAEGRMNQDMNLMITLTVWSTLVKDRRDRGDRSVAPFSELLEPVDFNAVRFVPAPKDRQPSQTSAPQGGPPPTAESALELPAATTP